MASFERNITLCTGQVTGDRRGVGWGTAGAGRRAEEGGGGRCRCCTSSSQINGKGRGGTEEHGRRCWPMPVPVLGLCHSGRGIDTLQGEGPCSPFSPGPAGAQERPKRSGGSNASLHTSMDGSHALAHECAGPLGINTR